MRKEIKALLTRLGLKEREAQIYAICLRHPDGLFIHEIARESKIIRTSVDLVVKRLLQRGFVYKIKVGRRLQYRAQPPKILLQRQRQLADEVEQLLPLLKNVGGAPRDMEIISIEGPDGLRTALLDNLLYMKFAEGDKKNNYSFATVPEFKKLIPDLQKSYISKRIKMGAWFYGIGTKDAVSIDEWKSDARMLRSTKLIPHDLFPFRSIIEICGDSVIIYSPVPPLGGVRICNARIAESMRSLFKMIWKLLPDNGTDSPPSGTD